MTLSKRRQSFVIAGVLLFCGSSAEALVLYGPETGGTTDNTKAPVNGAPWDYVASIDGGTASGVYLGYGYVLTANHVNGPLASVSIAGNLYATDSSYAPFQIGGADLKLLRIMGDPGMEPLSLIGSNDADLGKTGTFIGGGVGKASEVPNQGWNWADDSTRLQRWGQNVTSGAYTKLSGLDYLVTSFDRPGGVGSNSVGDDEFSLSLGDSGGGLFIKYGNTWKLAGVAAAAEGGSQALYDTNAALLLDQQPTRSFYTPVKLYRDQIVAAIPEPSTAGLVVAGAAAFLGRSRRRRLPQDE